MKKLVAVSILLAAVGAGVFLWWKNKKQKQAELPALPSDNKSLPAPSESLEDKTFSDMSAVLEADPVWKNNPFPGDFYPAVLADYKNVTAGSPRTPTYDYGKVGSFMSVVDAWMGAMGISKDTHDKLWAMYGSYMAQYTKSKLI